MKARIKKKRRKQWEARYHRITIVYPYPINLKKRRKAILRAHKIKPWLLHNVLIRYSFGITPSDIGICWMPWRGW